MRTSHWLCVAGAAMLFGAGTSRAGNPICFEAESAVSVTSPVKVVTAVLTPAEAAILKEASNAQYIEIPEGAGKPPLAGGEAVYRFGVEKPGEYWFWARTWWMDSCGNSFTILADGGRPFTFGEDGTYQRWHWVKGMKLNLAAGRHEIRILNREDGIKIDQLLLTDDPRYVPVGIEDATAGSAPAADKN